MEVRSAFNAGLQGLRNAQAKSTDAAANIAREVAPAPQTEDLATAPVSAPARPSLTDSIVQLKVAERTAEASAKVIKTADETLGTLIDTRA